MHSPAPTARQHVQGITLVLLTSIIWVINAVVTQYIFTIYPKPYLLTYISCSCFTLFLLTLPFTNHPNLISTAKFSALLTPFFVINFCAYTLGLSLTSVASSSTITTLTTLFALVIGAFVGTEPYTCWKFLATIMTIVGVAIISTDDGGGGKLLGDLLCLLSSFTYAIYGIMLKDRSTQFGIDVMLVQGFMGLFSMLTLWPFILLLHSTSFEAFQLPTANIMALLLANAIFGTVLSEFLFAKSVVLTSPMVSSLAISLTIPLSLLADAFVKEISFSFEYLLGTSLVLSAFLLVNWDMVRSRRAEKDNQISLLEAELPLIETT